MTWPASTEGLPSTRPDGGVLRYEEGPFIGYRAYDRDGRTPLIPFGHGLGYTAWEWLGMEVSGTAAGGATVRVRLRNAGARAGREVVQVYASRPGGAVERPPRWLAGFAAAEAAPGEEAAVQIAVPPRAFAHWDELARAWAIEAGRFELAAGRSSRDLRCTGELGRSLRRWRARQPPPW